MEESNEAILERNIREAAKAQADFQAMTARHEATMAEQQRVLQAAIEIMNRPLRAFIEELKLMR